MSVNGEREEREKKDGGARQKDANLPDRTNNSVEGRRSTI
jgi:hypothetical protein